MIKKRERVGQRKMMKSIQMNIEERKKLKKKMKEKLKWIRRVMERKSKKNEVNVK